MGSEMCIRDSLHRVWNDAAGKWEHARDTISGVTKRDSITHLYARTIGFVRHNQTAIDADQTVAAAYAFLKSAEADSHDTRVERFAVFERYVQDRHADDP